MDNASQPKPNYTDSNLVSSFETLLSGGGAACRLQNKYGINETESDVVWRAAVKQNPRDVSQVRGEGMKTGKWMIKEKANYISVSN